MSNSLLETVRILEQRAEYLEKEAVLLRQELAQVAEDLAAESPPESPVVARYTIEGDTYEITEADIEAVQTKMIKPRAERTLRELALVDKMGEWWRELPREEREQRFFDAIEESRVAAVADGTAINDEREAAVGD